MIHDKRKILFPLLLAFGVIIFGISGYMLICDYNFIDAFYMTIITISTVGYSEVDALTTPGRLFTIILILGGFATITYAASTIASYLVENVLNSFTGNKKMQKKINNLKNHYIICGCGRVGLAAIKIFEKAKVKFVILEPNDEITMKMKENGYLVITGNATHEEMLLKGNIKNAIGLISLAGTDPDNLFITLTARELNPTLHIISRAADPGTEKKLLRAGANKVILPLATAGGQIANDMLIATGKGNSDLTSSLLQYASPQWIKVKEGSSMVNSTIGFVSEEMQMSIIGVRTEGKDYIFPDKEKILKADDKLLVVETEDFKKTEKAEDKRMKNVLIVDDNPVIVHLFSRLLAMNGLNPTIATDGKMALEKIKKDKPDAAVLDFMLPIMSGIEICKKVKDEKISPKTKLIVYTGDDSEETRQKAFEAGADDFLLKTSDSGALVAAVVKSLAKDKKE